VGTLAGQVVMQGFIARTIPMVLRRLVTINAQPYSQHDWHWRLLVAHRFGHAAAAETVHGALKLLDDAGIAGELVLRELRSGRVEVKQMWGRPQSVRDEFKRSRAQ
jgi:hypothetical protein